MAASSEKNSESIPAQSNHLRMIEQKMLNVGFATTWLKSFFVA